MAKNAYCQRKENFIPPTEQPKVNIFTLLLSKHLKHNMTQATHCYCYNFLSLITKQE